MSSVRGTYNRFCFHNMCTKATQYRRGIRAPKIHSGQRVMLLQRRNSKPSSGRTKRLQNAHCRFRFFGRVAESLNWFLFFCFLRLLNAFGREPNTEHRHVRPWRFPQNVYSKPAGAISCHSRFKFSREKLKKNITLW